MPTAQTDKARWCFTLNNYTDEHERLLQEARPRYIIYGREVGASGTPHLQGYVEFTSRKSMAAVKQFLSIDAIHLIPANGTKDQNKAYCSKQDMAFYEYGDAPGQGRRTDLESYVATIKRGATMEEISSQFPDEFCKYHSAYEKLRLASMPKRDWVPNVYWYYGPTGTGKSHTAYVESGPDAYRKSPGKWWDGYEGQENVVFDEFRGDWLNFYELLKICDRYPLTVEVKGGHRQFAARNIWFTCPIKWDELYRGQTEEKLNQLQRRITETRYFPHRYVPPAPQIDILHVAHDHAEGDSQAEQAHDEEIDNWVDGFNPRHQIQVNQMNADDGISTLSDDEDREKEYELFKESQWSKWEINKPSQWDTFF